MVDEQFLRRGQIIDAEHRVEQARLCVEGHRRWMQQHRDHPDLSLAADLLNSMEAALIECELHRDQLVRMSLQRGH